MGALKRGSMNDAPGQLVAPAGQSCLAAHGHGAALGVVKRELRGLKRWHARLVAGGRAWRGGAVVGRRQYWQCEQGAACPRAASKGWRSAQASARLWCASRWRWMAAMLLVDGDGAEWCGQALAPRLQRAR